MLYKRSKIKTNRLIKKSEFFNGVETDKTNSGMLSIFKNPTDKEIEEARKESVYSSVRGVVTKDGTIYCWAGSVLHRYMEKNTNVPVDGDVFRFACEGDSTWIFDLHRSQTYEEGFKRLVELKDVISRFGNLEEFIDFYYGKDDARDYKKYDIGIMYEDTASFRKFSDLEKMVNKINSIENDEQENKEPDFELELDDDITGNDIFYNEE